jgi:hypothetical protein
MRSRNLSNNFIESIYVDTDNASVIPYVLYVGECRRLMQWLTTCYWRYRDVSNNPITSMSMENAQIIFLYALNVNVRNMTHVTISNSTIYL